MNKLFAMMSSFILCVAEKSANSFSLLGMHQFDIPKSLKNK